MHVYCKRPRIPDIPASLPCDRPHWQILAAARLDVLVFADIMSEAGTYFLSCGRFAAVQVIVLVVPQLL